MSTRFADAAECVPEPCQVAGTPLRPFCLGHHLLLKVVAPDLCNPPPALAAIISEHNLMLGTFICAQSYKRAWESFLDGSFAGAHQLWLKRVKKQLKRGTFIKKDCAPLFVAYLMTGYAKPPILRRRESSFAFSAPWEMVLKTFLMGNGYSEDEVLDGYLPARWYEYYTILEREQLDTQKPDDWVSYFVTRDNAEAIDAAKEMRANG